MKIAVCIMSTDMQPSLRNIDAMKSTFIAKENILHNEGKLNNEYDFFIYYSKEDGSCEPYKIDGYENVYNVEIPVEESVYMTFEKTIMTFIAIKEFGAYDYFVRINISTHINIELLDKIVGKLNKNFIYCNALNSYVDGNSKLLNHIYPRGDFYMTGTDVIEGILEQSEKYMFCDKLLKNRPHIEHVDDCLVGACIIDYMGKEYYKNLKMLKYNFLGGQHINIKELDKYAIASRVKTIPPNVNYSGYSWDDNEYRKYDGEKMQELEEYQNTQKYAGIVESDVLVDRKKSRPTLFVQVSNQNIYDVFYKYFEII